MSVCFLERSVSFYFLTDKNIIINKEKDIIFSFNFLWELFDI